jgi:hypothetical protein
LTSAVAVRGRVGLRQLAGFAERRERARLREAERDDRRLRQQQFAHRLDQFLVLPVLAARVIEHRIQYDGHVGEVRERLRHRLHLLGIGERPDLEGRHRHVLQHRSRLHRDEFGVDRQPVIAVFAPGGRDRGDDRRRMTAHARARELIGLHARCAGGVR